MKHNNNFSRKYIVGLGEALWDCLPTGKTLGGAPANFAFHAGQFGLDAIAVSALGMDALGDDTLKEFNNKGLETYMPRVDFPTGTVKVTVNAEGIPAYEIKEGVAWDNIPFTDEMRQIAAGAKAVCWGSLAQRGQASRDTILKFVDTTPADCLRIFDINLRQNFYGKDVLEASFKRCNILKINDEELDIVCRIFNIEGTDVESRCRSLMSAFALGQLILTCGENGSYVFSGGDTSFLATPKVRVADTVGAGDSFTGAFCAAILQGLAVSEAHKLAVDVSAYVCTQKGAMPKLPAELTSRTASRTP